MKYKLSEIMDLIGGGTPKTSKAEYWDGDIPWLSVKDFNDDFRYVYKTEKHITQLGLENSSTKLLQPGDIIVSARGTVGELATIPFPMAFNQSCYGLRAKKEIVNEDFLYYLIKHNVYVLKRNTHGSVFDTITRGTFEGIEVDIPALDVQARIAGVLSDLDKKIELNSRINENLQQQMSTIYKEKFSYVLQGNTATVEQIVAFSNGKKRPNEEGNIPVYGGNGVLAYTNKFNSQNCIIIGRVGAYCGNVSYSPKECWVSDNAIEAKSKVSASQLFAFHLLKNAGLPSRHIGTGQPLMTQGILNAIPCALPDLSEIDAFNDLCEPLQQQFDNNLAENVQLAALRETILPKLMSGELSLSDIEL
ncbi:restriction endonuclease subunit S [Mediterraneibacter gnavus]|uniref:Restriction endonuclease subunit S n=1 Tax=Mediterraneibacter gnavus TaxID=33038 RepID=A0A9X3HPI2_MEDGN|nr:restriction endonuclease subunit S [Mediterraneibacter gnavus]MCZ7694397.1 restriction endonuclease subunit S [Mediterraneibacter gnavus]MDC6148364.1 restriction endonuclease subunit S [Mediterraneibacter gnavus]MDE1201781.1 restriction endonuclease subunit S [Mediterraneibacter gnavus]